MRKSNITKRDQLFLKELGFYNGAIDGIWGPKSRSAIIQFQRVSGLVPDGINGPRTRNALRMQQDSGWRDKYEKNLKSNDGPSDVLSFKRWPRDNTSSLTKFYGKVGSSRYRLELPYRMKLSWNTSKRINTISCHAKVAESLYNIFADIREHYTPEEITRYGFDLYGGCYNVRKIRGGSRWSTHSWGCAVDLNPAQNTLRTKWRNASFSSPECEAFVAAFEKEGWYSLGKNKNFDAMHFQACWRR